MSEWFVETNGKTPLDTFRDTGICPPGLKTFGGGYDHVVWHLFTDAVHYTKVNRYGKVKELLERYRANPNSPAIHRYSGVSMFVERFEMKDEEMVRLFLQYGANYTDPEVCFPFLSQHGNPEQEMTKLQAYVSNM
jgi:hypothetical protein